MLIKLDHQEFDLSADQVRTRLEGRAPGVIERHWAEIDGVRWPVKQALSLATGVDRRRFRSSGARRTLRRLGFAVGVVGPERLGLAGDAQVSESRADFDRSQLDPVETVDVRIRFDWLRAGAVTLDGRDRPRFPALPRSPGLYRFDFGIDAQGTRTLYVGESKDLARRGRNYRNATRDHTRARTSRRIHREVVDHLLAGGEINFDVATEVFTGEAMPLDLRRRSARRLAENGAVLLAQVDAGSRVLNIDVELVEDKNDEA